MAFHRRHHRSCTSPGGWRTTKKGSVQAQALGRSRGGFGTKIHAVVDALCLPIRFELGPGQQSDMAPACELVTDLHAGKVLADRLHDIILDQGGEPVIPPRRHRKYQHEYDRIAYRQRWGIEGFFAKLQALATNSNTLRQAQGKLPRLHKARLNYGLDQIVNSSLQPKCFRGIMG